MYKQRFINLLSERFEHFGVKTGYANDNSDLLISQIAIEKTQDIPVNVICEDINVICLLWHYFSQSPHNIEACISDPIWEIRRVVNTRLQDHKIISFQPTHFWVLINLPNLWVKKRKGNENR